mgnify:CR=1 FL=1
MMNDAVPYFVYIPYTTAQNISGKSEYDKIAVLLDKNGDGKTAIDRIKTCMANVKGEGSIKISELQSQKKQLDGILAAATSALSFTAGISLAVASVSVMTAMLVSVGERKREIGIKKIPRSKEYKNSRRVLSRKHDDMYYRQYRGHCGRMCGGVCHRSCGW